LTWIACAVLASCGAPEPDGEATLTMLFAGDVMLGRGVASVAAADPRGLFEDVRFIVAGADLAVANLESPLTVRPHVGPSYALEADPGHAALLAAAGFDAMAIANNHAGDAGPPSILDTIEALGAVDVKALGGGVDWEAATRPVLLGSSDLSVAALAFDVSGAGLEAGAGPGIVRWDAETARRLVDEARRSADVVTVAIHGGVEYEATRDPELWAVAGDLAGWGVDVVWGHGPHVAQPVELIDPDGDGRPTVVATSLGNFLFDQDHPGTRRGAVLEVLLGNEGVRAFRIGSVNHDDARVHFEQWRRPEGDAVLLGLDWWTPIDAEAPGGGEGGSIDFPPGDVRDFGYGDVTGDGAEELVVAFRRSYRETEVTRRLSEHDWTDAEGRSAHVGVYRPGDLRQWWVAGSLFRPIEEIAVCDGSLAVAYSELDDAGIVATGGWRWQGFGFAGGLDLPGGGIPGCQDVDGDGRTDPIIVGRP
jgi:poly-gamma-glutamate synthesis protein (capsule biosynthesis protein)